MVKEGEPSRAALQAEALAHLLACLHSAVGLMDEVGQDCDARVVEAHAAQLAAGKEWPGEPITPPIFGSGSVSDPAHSGLISR